MLFAQVDIAFDHRQGFVTKDSCALQQDDTIYGQVERGRVAEVIQLAD